MKQRYLLPIFAVLFTAAVSFGINAFASTFTEPSGSPTSYNAPAPLDTSANANTKVGGLLLNSGGATNGLIVQSGNVGIGTASPGYKLDVSGAINGSQVCIGADCRSSWPPIEFTIYAVPASDDASGCPDSRRDVGRHYCKAFLKTMNESSWQAVNVGPTQPKWSWTGGYVPVISEGGTWGCYCKCQ